MIIRVFRYRLRAGTASSFESVVAADGFPALAMRRGLRFAYAGRDATDPLHGVVVTAWSTFDDLTAIVGAQLDRPTFLPQTFEFAEDPEVSHWEAVDTPPIGTGSHATVLRLLYGHVRPGMEGAYFGFLRTEAWPRLAVVDGLSGAWVGRQADEARDEPLLAVSTWTSPAALTAAARDAQLPLFGPNVGAGFEIDRIELFDIYERITAADAGHAADSQVG